jgi:CubicO group peptidase (beta-lactamase class C family)
MRGMASGIDPVDSSSLASDAEHWAQRLETLAVSHGVVGAVLGILRGDEVAVGASGVTNVRTDAAIRTDTVFQIGSITKAYTATAVLRLVAEGLLDLDAPVASALPELRLADPDTTRDVTLRHLLTHTSGLTSSTQIDTGRGDDCLQRHTAALADLPLHHPLAATFSYCNAGYSLAGRVIERVTGMVWDEAMRELVFAPLGVEQTMTLPEEALRHSVAMGHNRHPDGTVRPAARWGSPRSSGPAGGIIATAQDVLAFAKLHIDDGVAPDGTRLLSTDLTRHMRAKHANLPYRYGEVDSWGLGWSRHTWGDHSLIGHEGDRRGQTACLRILPAHKLAVVLLTNGGPARGLYRALVTEIAGHYAGLTPPAPPQPPDEPTSFDIARHAGVYQRTDRRIEVVGHRGDPLLRWTITGPLAELAPATTGEYETAPADENLLLYREPGQHRWGIAAFYHLPDGRPCLHESLRANPIAANS